MAKLDQIIHDIHNELGADMLFIDVVGTDGLSIAAERTQNLDTAAIAARFSLVEKLAAMLFQLFGFPVFRRA